jgi:hypothetical protein
VKDDIINSIIFDFNLRLKEEIREGRMLLSDEGKLDIKVAKIR